MASGVSPQFAFVVELLIKRLVVYMTFSLRVVGSLTYCDILRALSKTMQLLRYETPFSFGVSYHELVCDTL